MVVLLPPVGTILWKPWVDSFMEISLKGAVMFCSDIKNAYWWLNISIKLVTGDMGYDDSR